METDAEYFRRRASEEFLAAKETGHPGARRAHREMAARFEDLADAIAARERYGREGRRSKGESASRRAERVTLWL